MFTSLPFTSLGQANIFRGSVKLSFAGCSAPLGLAMDSFAMWTDIASSSRSEQPIIGHRYIMVHLLNHVFNSVPCISQLHAGICV